MFAHSMNVTFSVIQYHILQIAGFIACAKKPKQLRTLRTYVHTSTVIATTRKEAGWRMRQRSSLQHTGEAGSEGHVQTPYMLPGGTATDPLERLVVKAKTLRLFIRSLIHKKS